MDKKAVKVINLFLRKIRKDFLIDRILFFGSRAGSDYLVHSDIDLIVISEDFEGMDFTKRMSKMYDYWVSSYDVDFICYTPNEFEKLSRKITLAKEALRTGVIFS